MPPAYEHRFRFSQCQCKEYSSRLGRDLRGEEEKHPEPVLITVPPAAPHCIGLYAHGEAASSPCQGQTSAEESQPPAEVTNKAKSHGGGGERREVTIVGDFMFQWLEHEPQ